MVMVEFNLTRLLQPVGRDEFLVQHWGREPLLVRRDDSQFYEPLVTQQAIESFVFSGGVRQPDLGTILNEYHRGVALTLPQWQYAWPPLEDLCSRLESDLDHVVNAQVCLMPHSAKGLTPYYDDHDALVLQVAGRRRWRVYPPPAWLPHRAQTLSFDNYMLPEKPLMECDLVAGDLLYLPRGYVHTTASSGQPSVHVTLEIAVYTWLELLSEACQSAVDLPQLRVALPPGFSRACSKVGMARFLPKMLRELADNLDGDEVATRFIQRVRRARECLKVENQAQHQARNQVQNQAGIGGR